MFLPSRKTQLASSIEEAIRNQYEFLVERFGGPPLFSQRKGHPALKARHRSFQIDSSAADKWLSHMNSALDDVQITGDEKDALQEFFYNVAYFLRNKADQRSDDLNKADQ